MNKKLFFLVMALFAVLPNYNVACADNEPDDDGIILPTLPHKIRSCNRPAVYVSYNDYMGAAEISFTGVLNNVTIKVYHEGMLVDDITIGTTSYGYKEIVYFSMGEGDYRVVVETKGNIIYNNTFEYTD